MSKGRSGFGKHALLLGAFVLVFLAWIGFILSESGTLPTIGERYTVDATVPSASLLTPGARVTVAGTEVGSVKSVERADPVGPGAKLTLELTDDRVTPLPVDSRVQVRTRSQVGENYVAIVIGKERQQLVPDGGELALQNADELVDVDQILSIVQGKTRERTRTLFREFGKGLTGREADLNATIQGVNGFAEYAGRLVAVLHRDRKTVAQLVDQLGRVTAAVGDRGAAIDTFARQGLVSLRAIGDHDEALAATLRELPSTLQEVRKATTTLGDVSDRAAPVVSNLATATRELKPSVEHLLPAARDARSLLPDLDKAIPALNHAVNGAGHVGDKVPQNVPDAASVFCELNPTLRYLDRYKKDTLQIAFHLGSGSNSYDATGHMVRLIPIVNENSLSGAPPVVLDAVHTLLQSGAFLPQKVINYDPYMKPGVIGKTTAEGSKGQPSGPKSLKDSGFKYERVEADC